MKPEERCSSSVDLSRDSYERVYAEALLHVTEHASGDAVDKIDHLIDVIGAHYEPHHDDDHDDHHDDDHGDHHDDHDDHHGDNEHHEHDKQQKVRVKGDW